MNTLSEAKKIEDFVIDIRREIHANPELAEQEFKTQELIIKELEKLGIKYEKVGATSIIAYIEGEKKSNHKTIALRADMDALPMQEETDVTYKSKISNVAHMCGHDVHSSMLLGAARILNENKSYFGGVVKLFFQEGEERLVGAKKIIAAGGMNDVDACFSMHVMDSINVGECSIVDGYRMAGADEIYIDWIGVSGHGSSPHLANDSIHAAAVFTADLQSMITKNINPQDVAVVGVGSFHGGSVPNIISKYTSLSITFRYFKDEVQEIIHREVSKHAKNIGNMYGVDVNVDIQKKVKGLYNDPEITKLAANAFEKLGERTKNVMSPALMGSEDFSEYLAYAPGAMGLIGIRNEEKECIYFPHHERFKVDEDALKYGVAWYAQVAIDFLNQ